jgi:hypothetical protein
MKIIQLLFFSNLFLTGTLLWVWAGYHDIASTAISVKARMIKRARSQEPTMTEMVDVSRVLAQG